MYNRLSLTVFLMLIFIQVNYAQLSIAALKTNYTIDFDNTVAGVNSGSFDGSGFASSPSNGQIDCDGLIATGLSDGDGAFGGDSTSGDFARGSRSGGVGTGGIYAFEVSIGNYALGVQPIGSDFTPGSFILKLTNNTGSTIYAINVSYNVYVYNDKGRANAFNFYHSSDNSTYTNVSELDLTSTATADGSPSWSSTSKSTTISISISDGASYYLKWTGDDNSGSGNRDEFALDDIVIFASEGTVIAGDSGFRMMSSPISGQIYSDLLSELWTQGMTGADVTSGSANVWTFDVSSQSWTALSNLSTASLTAGEGFLVYVFADTDNDGTDDLPVTLSVSGTENSSSATVGNISSGNWALVGNPYAQTIDWNLVTRTNVTTSVYVWDDASSAYKTWNGSIGSLTNGLIAPYQSFWVQASSVTGSVTIEMADKSSSAGTFYKTLNDSAGSMNFTITAGDYSDQTFVSFMNNGEEGIDNADAYKLLPMTPTERVVCLSFAEGNGLDINNLPYSSEGSISIPLDIMYLSLDENTNFVTEENEVTITWNLSNLPMTITAITLTDNITGTTINLDEENEYTFTTEEKGNFPAYGSGGVNIYPQVGESHFTLTISYGALTAEDEPTNLPKEFALYPAYPNPFNLSTTIKFNIAATYATLLQVYDIKGQWVETLINEALPIGSYSIQWNPNNLSSGLYILQLKAGNKTFNQKITLLK
ncbi:MAG: T9SS type A sorting domain-containing protein [Candidatus Marinimicrobia bacterium]|nr:T9SS type A sorting domain-containing protein [Candidatus Neomarinimicrobiota bacterium]